MPCSYKEGKVPELIVQDFGIFRDLIAAKNTIKVVMRSYLIMNGMQAPLLPD
jgi:hypothetical protein